MDAQGVTSLITTVGFPIVAYLLMFWYVKEQNEAHTTETKEMKEAINSLTLMIQKLTDKLESWEK